MKLRLIRHLWGVIDPLTALPRFRDFGYEGIEAPVLLMPDTEKLVEAIHDQEFDFVAQILTAGLKRTPCLSQHLDSFASQLEAVAAFSPVKVVVHSGFDGWNLETAAEFFDQALKIAANHPFPVAHETHRGRWLFNPWNCAAMLDHLPDLKLCCDFSHWVCVCERLIDDQLDIIHRAASRCIHLHARVGYEQGPQVPDPADPQYALHLAAHERWWDIIWQAQQERGDAVSTLTPEFGPPPYLHTRREDNQPVIDLETVCDWMASRQSSRFKERNG